MRAYCSVGRHRGADELLKGSFVDLLPLAEVDRTPRVPFQAGIEELLSTVSRTALTAPAGLTADEPLF
jgi:hypothetical protein